MTKETKTGELPENSLAVVGMAGRFPGAKSVDEFWRLLREGREGITFFEPQDLDPSIASELRSDARYVRAKGVVADFDKFDAGFFGVSPLEAKLMDPQQRIMLEMAWEALERSGHCPSTFPGLIGLYAGADWNRYARHCVWRRPDIHERYGETNTAMLNEFDFLTTRVSYKLNLRGPSVNMSTACSTSLVAVAQAAQGLLGYDCDIALAGGISISVPINAGYLYQEGGMLSADGHCRTFDATSTGTTFNDGATLVVLRRLEDAVEDGDPIYAVLRGFAVNNDGSDKVSYTAPSVSGQSDVIRSAIDFADIDPGTIGYVEAHGTATPLGDPIEIAALKKAFAATSKGNDIHCALGSAKANVGHLIHAAGVAGLIKAVLAVHHGEIPPHINFDAPNPKLELDDSGFYINTEAEAWRPDGHPRRAGVSSFGVGGTNAHIIVEQAPVLPEETSSGELQVLCVSAKNKEARSRQIDNLRTWMATPTDDVTIDAVAHTLWAGREPMQWRAAWVADSLSSASEAMAEQARCVRGRPLTQPETAFMFTGQGSQRINMGAGLRKVNPTFREWFDRGLGILRESCKLDLSKLLFSDSDIDESVVEQTGIAQPALFLYEFSLAKALMESGLTPQFLVGHSIGELVAATLAGIWSFDDGIRLAAKRGSAMQALPPGSMVALYCTEEEARRQLTDGLVLAGMNAPELTVVSGETAAVDAFCESLEARDLPFKRLRVSHAFHSAMMKPAVETMKAAYSSVAMQPPSIPVISTVTGQAMTDAQAVDPDYWANQLLEPVRFASAVDTMLESGDKFLVEVGPGTALTTLAAQNANADRLFAWAASQGAGMGESSARELMEAVAAAWTCGVDVDLSLSRGGATPRKVALPTYPFARDAHWIDPPEEAANVIASVTPITAQAAQTVVQSGVAELQPNLTKIEQSVMSDSDKISILDQRVISVFEDTSGYDLDDADVEATLIELGFDSLLLTQASSALKKEFSVDITFRELMEDYTSIREISEFLLDKVDLGELGPAAAPAATAVTAAVQPPVAAVHMAAMTTNTNTSSDVQTLIDKQLLIMQQQLQVLAGGGQVAAAPQAVAQPAAAPSAAQPAASTAAQEKPTVDAEPKKKRTPGTRIEKHTSSGEELTRAQQAFIDKLIEDYTKATAKSKEFVTKHRKQLADPRTVSGFTPLLKEMVYPIVTDRSKGSKVWDVDGREYLDLTNGFGPVFFGHSPDFINDAVIKQIHDGVETGPQSPLAGEVAELFCELTGNERVAYASTGSEAVACALRLARAVTGRDKVVIFENSYHGIFDEVIVRPGKGGAGLPAANGIPREMAQNMIVLPYGTDETLARIKELAADLAAVMVEPIQSRNPDLQPGEFLKEVREVTEASGTALIFDEVVTGFRVHPGGAQAHFGIRADLATYGKVAGGGYPIGLIGGKPKFLDALDGGQWQYGDDSIPEVGVTFFAGTFVRHPLALAATKASLQKLKDEGPALQQAIADRTSAMVDELKSFVDSIGCPFKIEHFSSYCYPAAPPADPHGGLLFYLLRLYGIHTWEFRPWFLTASHTEEDIAKFVATFKRAVTDMVRIGLLTGDVVALERAARSDADKPPVDGAKLGKDASGMPAWFAPDPDRPGKYIQLDKRRAS